MNSSNHPPDQGTPPSKGAKPRIAVIDDEQIWLKTFERFFKRSGYAVDTYANPGDFLGVIQRAPDKYAGIICDMKMPKLDGHQVFQALQANPRTRKIPFIIVSGVLTQEEYLSKAQPMTYISKLNNNLREKIFEELIDVIEHWPKLEAFLRAQSVAEDKIDLFCRFYINYAMFFHEILKYINDMETACVKADQEAIQRLQRECNEYMSHLYSLCLSVIELIREKHQTSGFAQKVCHRGRTSLNMIQTFQFLLTEEPGSNAEFRTFLKECKDQLEKIIIGSEQGYNLRDENG